MFNLVVFFLFGFVMRETLAYVRSEMDITTKVHKILL